jgi:hypothetical protein
MILTSSLIQNFKGGDVLHVLVKNFKGGDVLHMRVKGAHFQVRTLIYRQYSQRTRDIATMYVF